MRIDRRMSSAGLFVVLFLAASGARSQTPDTAADKPAEWLIGMSLGVPGSGSSAVPQLFTAGLQFTQVRAGHIGGDIAIGTMPYLFSSGIFPLGFRGDVTVPIVMPHLIVLPVAGVSAIGVMSPGGGGGGIGGLNAGIAAIVHSYGMGLRAGVTWHQFMGMNNPVWLAELGFVSIGSDPP